MAEHPTEKNLPWLVLRAANRTQARGSTVRLIVPRAPEVAEDLGMELTEARLLSVEENLQAHGYVEPANIGLTWGTYTITPAGLRWLEEAPSESPQPPTEAPESVVEEPRRESPETPVERPEGKRSGWMPQALRRPLRGCGGGECSGAEVSDHYHKMSVEQMRAHLARAERELQAAQRFLNPRTRDEAELDVVRAVANARTSVGDALETLRLMGERGG